jgi:hypothetical protein
MKNDRTVAMSRRRFVGGALGAGFVAATDEISVTTALAQGAGVFRPATDKDLAEILRRIGNKEIDYNYRDMPASNILVADGDVVIDGEWNPVDIIAIFGNLTVNGLYDDFVGGTGVVTVFGNMAAHDIYSWGALHVTGDLNVRGLVLPMYNDYTFEVEGVVNARGLISMDKFAVYKEGNLPFAFDAFNLSDQSPGGMAEQQAAWQALVPELFTGPNVFYPDEVYEPDAMSFAGFMFDDQAANDMLHAGKSVWRRQPSNGAPTWDMVVEVFDLTTTEARLAELIQVDLMLAQLVAARPGKSEKLVSALRGMKDQTVDYWLSQ